MANANATKQGVSVGACFGSSEGDEAAYADVRDRFLSLGGKASEWHLRPAREAMCAALTYAEDRLELRRPKSATRVSMRTVRRRLEAGLWG